MFALVVMAAGIGRRFGGDKQLVEVGPDGETFLDYAISAAAGAGASKVVLVVRSEIEPVLRTHVDARHGERQDAGVAFAYVRQDQHGAPRSKPWGTAHAVLVAAAEAKAREIGVDMDIAITGDNGRLLMFHRMDGGRSTSIDVAICKAFTASAARRSTRSPREEWCASWAWGCPR